MKLPRLSPAAPALAVIALFLSGCEGPDRRAMMEEARHSIPPMAANEVYFDGQIAVHLTLAGNVRDNGLPGGRERGKAGKMTGMGDVKMGENNFGAGDAGMGGDMGGGMGGGMGGMGGGGMGGGAGGGGMGGMGGGTVDSDSGDGSGGHHSKGGTYQGNQGMNHINETDEGESEYARRQRDAEMPPALLRLRLENTSQATVIVEIQDLNSDLGNFAVRPDTVTLNPGQTVETDPMQSKLGVDSYNLPVTITLRAGGQTETKTLMLRLVNPAPSAPSTPPAK